MYKKGSERVTFYNHEVMGSKLARKILRRLKFDKATVATVSELVYNHMYNYEPNKWSEAAVRRFINKIKITEGDLGDLDNLSLFLLRKADRAGSGVDLSEVSPRQYVFQDHIKRVYERSKALDVKDLDIDGSTIMEKFYLKPGPTIGHVLNHLLSLVIEDQSLNKRKKLIEEASRYLSEALK
jgi:poly(A) polymerase/tRNA nucleotidyltransferase (CCA-adding enzyme)